MRYGDVTEEDQERMSSDEYMVSRDRLSTKLFHAYIQAFLAGLFPDCGANRSTRGSCWKYVKHTKTDER